MTIIEIKEKDSNESIYVNLDHMTYFYPTSGYLYMEHGDFFRLDDESNENVFDFLNANYNIHYLN